MFDYDFRPDLDYVKFNCFVINLDHHSRVLLSHGFASDFEADESVLLQQCQKILWRCFIMEGLPQRSDQIDINFGCKNMVFLFRIDI